MQIRTPPIFAMIIFWCSTLAAQPSSSNLLDQFIQSGMQEWQIPGLAVVVVKDGNIELMKAYGVNNVETAEPVDLQTMGMMGSTTKAVTALAIAMLVDEKKMQWDDRVVDHLPDFQLSDPYITKELRIRDLLCHRSGIGNTDFLWFSGLDETETLHRMRHAPVSYSFRAGYTYQNVMYLAAGKVIEKVSGRTWSNFIQRRIFEPIGMARSVPKASQLEAAGNHMSPHYLIDDRVQVIEQVTADQVAPAGDIWASIEDMEKWISFLLDSTVLESDRLISAINFSELFKPHTIVPTKQFYPTTVLTTPSWTTYGLGWFQQDYRGHAVQFHTGSLPGLIAILGLVPEENLGIYVFGNMDHAELRHAILWKAIDLFLHRDNTVQWHRRIYDLYAEQKAQAKKKQSAAQEARKVDTQPSRSISSYLGNYQNDLYGKINISGTDDFVVAFNSALEGEARHWHYDTFQLRWNNYTPPTLFSFQLNTTGEIDGLKLLGAYFKKIKNQ